MIRRRARDGSTSWFVQVRVQGYPAACRTFRTKAEAELWSARTEAAARGRTLAVSRGMIADIDWISRQHACAAGPAAGVLMRARYAHR